MPILLLLLVLLALGGGGWGFSRFGWLGMTPGGLVLLVVVVLVATGTLRLRG